MRILAPNLVRTLGLVLAHWLLLVELHTLRPRLEYRLSGTHEVLQAIGDKHLEKGIRLNRGVAAKDKDISFVRSLIQNTEGISSTVVWIIVGTASVFGVVVFIAGSVIALRKRLENTTEDDGESLHQILNSSSAVTSSHTRTVEERTATASSTLKQFNARARPNKPPRTNASEKDYRKLQNLSSGSDSVISSRHLTTVLSEKSMRPEEEAFRIPSMPHCRSESTSSALDQSRECLTTGGEGRGKGDVQSRREQEHRRRSLHKRLAGEDKHRRWKTLGREERITRWHN
ncbi:unnamed protein product [Cyprideis torosa]|uniref:Uncharacterized protein n=1 Tax=Cyprideis torosa TaxID=163714 RepID=A0A7R8WSR0_9CRUS|nr:unnamed protein product [Cyprideis torosa]CAG0904037.1 unnamed protein product [Cyprideis torosa]